MTIKSLAMKAGLAGAILLGAATAAFAAEAQATTAVNVRLGPGTQYGIVDQLAPGERVDVLGCSGTWCQISHPGPDGWVSAKYLARSDGYDDGYYDDGYYDGPDIIIHRYPHRRPAPYYWRYPHRPYSSFCVGGPNARFCISN